MTKYKSIIEKNIEENKIFKKIIIRGNFYNAIETGHFCFNKCTKCSLDFDFSCHDLCETIEREYNKSVIFKKLKSNV